MCIGSVHWMWGALTPLTPSPPPGPPPPARRVPPPRNTWPRHATVTHRAHQWEIDRLVDGGGGDGESPAHAPRFPYRLGIHGTVWGFGLIAFLSCVNAHPPLCSVRPWPVNLTNLDEPVTEPAYAYAHAHSIPMPSSLLTNCLPLTALSDPARLPAQLAGRWRQRN